MNDFACTYVEYKGLREKLSEMERQRNDLERQCQHRDTQLTAALKRAEDAERERDDKAASLVLMTAARDLYVSKFNALDGLHARAVEEIDFLHDENSGFEFDLTAAQATIAKLKEESEWSFDLITTPRGLVDLLIEGEEDKVRFYCPVPHQTADKQLWRGRVADCEFGDRKPNLPKWYPLGGLSYPLSPNVRVIAWRPFPAPPSEPTT